MKTLVAIWVSSEYGKQMSLIGNNCQMSNISKNSGSFRNIYKYSTIGYSSIYSANKKEMTVSFTGSDNWFMSEYLVSYVDGILDE